MRHRVFDLLTSPWLVILSLPFVVAVALRLPAIAQNNFTDAMYYLGYSRNFVDLIDRYGFIYYAVRFGPIFSEMAFSEMFGPMTGFHVLRYLLFAGVGFLLHAVLSERYGRRTALFGVIAWGFNAVTARILLSTYVDSIVVPFTLMGLLLLLIERDRSLPRSFVAGMLLCAGVSGNVYAGFMIAFALPAYVWLNGSRPFRQLAFELGATFAGAASLLILFTVIYDQLFGVSSLLQPYIDVIFRLAGGDAKQWTRPLQEWLIDSPHIYAPFLVLIATATVWHWQRDRLALAAASYLALFILFYWFSDLVLDAYSLSFYPYFSYWQAPLMLGLGVVTAQIIRSANTTRPAVLTGVLIAALTGPPLLFANSALEPPAFGWMVAAIIAALIGWLTTCTNPRRWPYGLLGLVAAAVLLQSGSPAYRSMLGNPDADDRGMVQAALDLIPLLPRVAEDGKSLAFWYTSGDRRVRMVQSIYLPFSRLERGDRSPIEIGPLATNDIEVLNNPQLAHLIIIDPTEAGVDRALKSLDAARIPYRLAQRHRLGSKRYRLELAQVILEHRTDPVVAEWPATAFRPDPEAAMRYDTDGAVLTTAGKIYNWDARMDLAPSIRPGLPVTATVTVQVLEGRVSLALIRRGSPDRVLHENLAPRTVRPVQISVTTPEAGEDDLLVIRNQMEDGTRAVVRIQGITIRQPSTDYASLPVKPIP